MSGTILFVSDTAQSPFPIVETRTLASAAIFNIPSERTRRITCFLNCAECQLDCLSIFDRLDVHEKLIKLVRDNGFIPIGLSELTSISLPEYKRLDYAAYWTWFSKGFQFEDKKTALKAIKNADMPVTSFKSLSGGRLVDDIDGAIKFLYVLS